MNTLVVYYSYSGKTAVIAKELAKTESADIVEIKDARRPSKLKAYTAGIIASIKGKPWPIHPPGVDFAKYDRLILLAPIWAGNPPPPFNALLLLLPDKKKVAVKMVSASGKSDCRDRIDNIIASAGCEMESFEDLKA